MKGWREVYDQEAQRAQERRLRREQEERTLAELRREEDDRQEREQREARRDARLVDEITADVMAQLDNTITLFGVIGDPLDGFGDNSVAAALDRLGDVDEVQVLLNSPGGDVVQGLGVYYLLATHPAKVTVDIVGVAASMASAIAMAGDRIRIAENGHLMLHDPWSVQGGNARELRKAADMLEGFGTSLARIYADRTGIADAEIKQLMAAETWFTAEEALERGFVDAIIEPAEAEAFASLDLRCVARFTRPIPASLAALVTAGCNTLNARRARARS